MTELPPRFILYRRTWDAATGKWGKHPCDAHGVNIDPHDPSRWMTYEQAAQHALWDETRQNHPYGVGWVLNQADDAARYGAGRGWFFYDLDDALGADGQWKDWATAAFTDFSGALGEISTSGNGLHVLGMCDPTQLADKRRKWGKTDGAEQECYVDGRFVALSRDGLQPIGGAWRDVDWTEALVRRVPDRPAVGDLPTGVDPAYTGPSDDAELIRMMLRSSGATAAFGGGVTFRDLWECNVTALSRKYPQWGGGDGFDHSSADLALMNMLAFWTGKDMPRMDRLFRMSALMRDKYERREDYRTDTVQAAARMCKAVYNVAPPAGDGPGGEATGVGAGTAFLTVAEMIEHFKGCTYVRDQHRVLVPDGALLKPEQFNATYGGFMFQMMPDGTKPTKKAFEAFTECNVHRFPVAVDVTFRPDLPFGEIIGGNVNTYVPPNVPCEPGDVSRFHDAVGRMLPDERDRRILYSWMCRVVQSPGLKPLWASIVQGAEGNGKGMLTYALCAAVGERYSHICRSSQIGSQFNGWMENKVLCVLEEAKKDRSVVDDLKQMITELRQPIRRMQQAEINKDCPVSWFGTTNHKDAVMKHRGDRRYATFFCAQQTKEDIDRDFPGDYWPSYWQWLKHEGGLAHVVHWLKTTQPDPEFDPGGVCTRAPDTSSTQEAIAASVGGIEGEILEAIESDMRGFRGGWISSVALDNLLQNTGFRVSRAKMGTILSEMGYTKWGRSPTIITEEDGMGKRPVMWVAQGVTGDIADYVRAQG